MKLYGMMTASAETAFQQRIKKKTNTDKRLTKSKKHDIIKM